MRVRARANAAAVSRRSQNIFSAVAAAAAVSELARMLALTVLLQWRRVTCRGDDDSGGVMVAKRARTRTRALQQLLPLAFNFKRARIRAHHVFYIRSISRSNVQSFSTSRVKKTL